MEQIIVTRINGTTFPLQSKANLSTITSATQTLELLNKDIVEITVESSRKMTFAIGDKITVIGRDYTMNIPAVERKAAENKFVYTLQYEGVQYELARATYDVNIDTTGADVQGDSLTGGIKIFLDVLIQNISRVLPGKWVLGTYPADTEAKTLTFGESDNCLSVLQNLCQEYNQEFEIDIDANGVRTLNIAQSGSTFEHTFEYDKGKGIYELTRERVDSSNIVNRLKVYGSTKNLTSKYRSTRLLLPGKTKAQSYLEDAASIAKFGVWENSKIFDDIYPHRIGVVSALGADHLTFVDSSMTFDLNEKEADGITTKYLMSGVAAKIHFNTGNLAGYEFDIHSYDHASKTFVIVSQKDERDMAFPSVTSEAFQISVGDEYVILDIALPQADIDTAEAKLQSEGATYLQQNCKPKVQYNLTIDAFFLKKLVGSAASSNIFWVGDYIPVKDTDLDVDALIRIKGFARNLLDEYSYQLTIADMTVTRTVYNRVISNLIDINKVIKINKLKDPARARRNYLAAQELYNMIFDTEGDYYSDKIKPLSIETSMLSVGAKSMQFGLENTVFQPNYAGAKNRIVYKGGTLTHYAILDANDNPRTWNITDGDVTLASDAAFYVYAKCQRTGSGGVMLFSTSKISVESDGSYFHFLIGIANSVDATTNTRALALMYGFTTINGRYIRTGRITSADGNTYFDLDTGEIGGKITFRSGSSGLTNMSEWPSVAQDIEAAQSTANQAVQSAASLQSFIDNTLPAELSSLQAQIDGQVESWDFPYVPTLSNYPASEWTTDALKDRHIHDTFYNNQPFVDNTTTPDAGKAWRFTKSGGTYFWNPISDSDAVKALLAASKAQDTADGKRRVFVTQPTTPYDVGDLWTQGSGGDIMRCINARLSGAYVAGDWDKAVKYTDDTAVNNLQIGGRNLLIGSAYKIMTANSIGAGISVLMSDEAEKYYRATPDSGKAVSLYGFGATSEAGKQYIRSIYVRQNSGNPVTVSIYDYSVVNSTKNSVIASGVWTQITTMPYLGTGASAYLILVCTANNVAIDYKKAQQEIGNKATDWTEAPEDVDAKIQDQQIYVEYSINGSTNWHTTFTTGDIFMRQKKGSGAWSAAIRIVGEKGDAGNEGRYTDYQFAKNTSTSTAPTSGWQDAPPAISAGEYVWMRVGEVIPPATSPASWSAATRITGDRGEQGLQGLQGAQGLQGIAGPAGANGQTSYFHIKYSPVANPTAGQMTETPDVYIGTYVDFTSADSTNPASYTWTRFKGLTGDQGIPGTNGADGVTYYLHIAYADSATGTGFSQSPDNKSYIGTYTDTNPTDSSNPALYTWAKFKGDQGPQGVPGTPGADGVTYYTWIRYADTSAGGGISNDPTGKLYIGFAYNKATAVESNTPSDYTWSLIKGEKGDTGVKGDTGANGVTTYTWIKYSDNADGTGLYDTPTANTKYIGIAVNKTTATESTTKTDYVWSLFKGADGKSVTATDVEFAQSASATVAPTSGWQTTAPAWEDGKYIWTRTKTTYSSGDPTYSPAVNLTGAKGTAGNTGAIGTGVESITEEYYLSTSKTTQTGGTWSTTPPTWSAGKYVWTRVKIVYKNPASTVYTTPIVSSEWEAVNEIQIGGRNLLIGSAYKIMTANSIGAGISVLMSDEAEKYYRATPDSGKAVSLYGFGATSEAGKQYIRSIYVRQNSGNPVTVSIYDYSVVNSTKNSVIASGVWTQITTMPYLGTGASAYLILVCTANNVAIDYKKAQQEIGNKATDWTPAPEDVQAEIDAAKSKAQELEYLKTALAGSTDIQGGLLLTRMMLLKNALDQVTAGVSGMDSNDVFLFANDTDALNAALNDMATFLMRRNGTGNLGNLRFTRDGMAYCPRLANGKLGAPIIEFRSTPIPPLSDLVASFTTSVNGVGGTDNKTGGVKTGNFGYSAPITVSAYDNFSMRIQGLLEASIDNAYNTPISDSHAAVNLVLYKYAGGVYTQERVVASLYIIHDATGSLSDSVSVDETFMLPKGTYYLRTEYYLNTVLNSLDSASISASSLVMTASGASGQKMMIFGSNGFVRIKDGTNYTYMSDEMMAHRGVLDIQGVLASASVSSAGSSSRKWGAKVGDSSKPSTGTYTINHSIGHTDYTIQITPNTAGRLAYISERYSTYCTVVLTNISSAATDTAFDYTVFGKN